MTTALMVCIVGGIFFLVAEDAQSDIAGRLLNRLGELGKWAFIIGLAAWFLGK